MSQVGPLITLRAQGYIFVSYAQHDKERVRSIRDRLQQAGYIVWWDDSIPVGDKWRREIMNALAGATCVLAIWSVNSVQSEWVTQEAEYGLRKGIYLGAKIDHVEPPMGPLRGKQSADLCAPQPTLPGRPLAQSQNDAYNAKFSKLVKAIDEVQQRQRFLQKPTNKPSDEGWRGAIVVIAIIVAALVYSGSRSSHPPNPTLTEVATATSGAIQPGAIQPAETQPGEIQPAETQLGETQLAIEGSVTGNGLRVRYGPDTAYDPPVAALSKGTTVRIVGQNTDLDGAVWWKIADPAGWIHSRYVSVEESGCTECVAKAAPPISNRGPLLSQGQNGWTYLLEIGRNTGNFTPFDTRESYEGVDCYRTSQEEYVRICQNGNIHPGAEGRIAYRWNSTAEGAVTVEVHAHKIDIRCGDGVSIGTFISRPGGRESKVGAFSISKGDNTGTTQNYDLEVSRDSYLLVVADIKNKPECDQTRLFIDINQR